MVAKANFDTLRSLGFAGIGAAYAALGSPTAVLARIITITNNTEGDMLISVDGTTDHLFVAAGSFKLYDLQSNINPKKDDKFVLENGTQFYIKQVTAPVSGSVYLEIIY